MRISGGDTRLVAAGPEERKRAAAWLDVFSQEDLTRYLSILLDLYRDLQHSPQPRFRLEIGLLKLVHAGRLRPLEEVLAKWNPGGAEADAGGCPPSSGGSSRGAQALAGEVVPQARAESAPQAVAQRAAAAGAGSVQANAPRPAVVLEGPSTPESDPDDGGGPALNKASGEQKPAADGEEPDLRARLTAALQAQGDEPLADAIEHGRLEASDGALLIRTLADYRAVLDLSLRVVAETASRILGRPTRVTLGDNLDATEAPSRAAEEALADPKRPPASTSAPPGESEAAQRALADPEIQKIQQLFAGQIREVRNLRGYAS
jgi:DNA polymerase-3 subunit gamma/tau